MAVNHGMLDTAIEAAQQAGELIAERYPAGRTLTWKGYRDFFTDADVAAEIIILEMIRARFPDHTILSEEAGGSRVGDGYTWIVDPLDGTTNYAHRAPIFSVSIGVLEGAEPLIGVIHDPLRGHTFAAERGRGARLDDQSIHVSDAARLSDAVIGLDWGRSNEVRGQVLSCLQRVVPRCATLRGLGSAALTLAYIAVGWLDAYFHLAIRPWDAAAGVTLITEAGGRCSTIEGQPYRVYSPSCLVTNGLIHEELLDVVRTAS